MHDTSSATSGLVGGTSPVVQAAVVPVVSVAILAIAIIGGQIIRPSAGGVLG